MKRDLLRITRADRTDHADRDHGGGHDPARPTTGDGAGRESVLGGALDGLREGRTGRPVSRVAAPVAVQGGRYRGPMAAIALRLRAELRHRWPAWLGVALIAGIAGGVVLGLLAGAVRTRDAYRDFSRTMHAADLVVAGRSDFGLAGAVDLDEVARLPQVRSTARATVSLLFTGRTGDGRRSVRSTCSRCCRTTTASGATWNRCISARESGGPRRGRRGGRQLRARPAARAARRRHHSPPFRAIGQLPDCGGDAPEQLRRPPRGRARVVEQRDRPTRRRAGRDLPHRRDRGVAGRVPARRARPRTAPPPHARVHRAVRQ